MSTVPPTGPAAGERAVISRGMRTRAQLAADLRTLGLPAGACVLVHASLSTLGWIPGGPVAVVQALLDVLGRDGTLVVPTHTGHNSDPQMWSNPPVPEEWWPAIREAMPGFHPKVTPTRGMGAIAEVARTWPVARRSDHPTASFAAIGPLAEALTGKHALGPMFGEGSPLARIRDARGMVLLLGVGHASNTSLHLAEYALAAPRRVRHGAAILAAGERQWVTWEDIDPDAGDFVALGAAFEATGVARIGPVGAGTGRLMSQPDLVEFGARWLTEHRRAATP